MQTENLQMDRTDIQKLLLCGNTDAAAACLYLRCGNRKENMEADLHISAARVELAVATLRQLGLWQEPEQTTVLRGQPPRYSETDVMQELNSNQSFSQLRGELQRILGRMLNTEELKIVLGFYHYLGLPPDVISVLVCYCREKAKSRGRIRTPSLRAIEKEAYFWADHGIDTLEEATSYIRRQNIRESRRGKLLQLLQITGRNPTEGEEKLINAWLDMGFDDKALAMAYERTCMNTGGLKWPYMNKILLRWHEAGLHTGEAVQKGDRKEMPTGSGSVGEAEKEAIRRIMEEG